MTHALPPRPGEDRTDPRPGILDAPVSIVLCHAGGDNAVIDVSDAFEAHTGYSRADAVGRNLSFLQGPETEPEAVSRFRHLIETAQVGTVTITNYRKDGTSFRHSVEMRPILSDDGTLLYFVAAQRAD
jgi:PAS domain S-box-containing protein